MAIENLENNNLDPDEERQGAATADANGDVAVEANAEAVEDGEQAKGKKAMPEIPISTPAMITCQEDLDLVLSNHAQWMKNVLDPKTHVPAGRANLKNADLRAYDLSGVNLSGANLSGANLQGVELVGANLTVANLQGTQLQCANLRSAKLRGAKVDGADLRGADLTDAVLLGCDLSKAILKGPETPSPIADNNGSHDGTNAELAGRSEI